MNYRPDRPIRDKAGKHTAWYRYRTLEEIASALDASIADDTKHRRLSSIRTSDKDGADWWSGTEYPAEYVTMLREGWAHGVEGVEGLDGLSTDCADTLTFVRDVGGVFPVIPAYLAGEPDCMLAVRPMPAERVRGLTLVIDSSFHNGIAARTVLDYARNVMQLVAWLQAQQIETSIYVVVPIKMGLKRIIYTIPIRETGDTLMPERIASILHPAFLRRGWFAMVEREFYDHDMKECSVCQGGFGKVRHVTADEMRQCLPEAYSVIMLPKVGSGDPTKAVKESITLKLKQQ